MVIADTAYSHPSPRQALRDLATRYAKRAAYYRAEILFAATMLWLR